MSEELMGEVRTTMLMGRARKCNKVHEQDAQRQGSTRRMVASSVFEKEVLAGIALMGRALTDRVLRSGALVGRKRCAQTRAYGQGAHRQGAHGQGSYVEVACRQNS